MTACSIFFHLIRAPDPRDPTSVTEARELETAIIKDWLNQ